MKKSYFKDGEWNCTCPICGREVKSSKMRKRWDGQMVCEDDLDPRHPQDFIRGREDNTSVPFVYAEPADQFTDDPGYDDSTLTTVPSGTNDGSL